MTEKLKGIDTENEEEDWEESYELFEALVYLGNKMRRKRRVSRET